MTVKESLNAGDLANVARREKLIEMVGTRRLELLTSTVSR
jgi:hypothetical protein